MGRVWAEMKESNKYIANCNIFTSLCDSKLLGARSQKQPPYPFILFGLSLQQMEDLPLEKGSSDIEIYFFLECQPYFPIILERNLWGRVQPLHTSLWSFLHAKAKYCQTVGEIVQYERKELKQKEKKKTQRK